MLRLILLLVALSNFHGSYGRPPDSSKPSPIREAIQRINPELDRIALRLKELKLGVHKEVLQATIEHHQAVSNSGKRVLQGLSDLQSDFAEIQQLAQDSDTEECLSRQRGKFERLVLVASQKIARGSEEAGLRRGNFTQKAKDLADEADAIERNLNKVIGFCIRQNNLAWQQDKLLQCLQEEALEIDKVVDRLYSEQSLIRTESSALEANLTGDEAGLLRWMQSIQNQLQECVVEARPTDYDYLYGVGTSQPGGKDGSGNEFKVTSYQMIEAENAPDILERINRLESLLHQLEKLHDGARESPTTTIPLNLSKTPKEDTNQVEASETAVKNHRYILYISF